MSRKVTAVCYSCGSTHQLKLRIPAWAPRIHIWGTGGSFERTSSQSVSISVYREQILDLMRHYEIVDFSSCFLGDLLGFLEVDAAHHVVSEGTGKMGAHRIQAGAAWWPVFEMGSGLSQRRERRLSIDKTTPPAACVTIEWLIQCQNREGCFEGSIEASENLERLKMIYEIFPYAHVYRKLSRNVHGLEEKQWKSILSYSHRWQSTLRSPPTFPWSLAH